MLTLTDCFNLRHNSSGVDNLGDIDDHRINHIAVISRSSHSIFNLTVSGGNSRNGRTSSGRKTITSPLVSHILIVETIKVSIQHDSFTFTDVHLVSSNLEVCTKRIDREVSSGNTTRDVISNSNSVNTCYFRSQSSFFTSHRTSPSNIIVTICRDHISNKFSLVAIANHVVTGNSNLRNCVNFNRFVCRRRSGGRADKTFRSCSKGIGTRSEEVQSDRTQILTRNLNAVHIPCIIINTISFGSHIDNTTFTNVFVGAHSNRQFGFSLFNHVDRDGTYHLTSATHLHVLGRCGHRVSGSFHRSDSYSRCMIIDAIPAVGNHLVAETIEISVQHHRGAGTHIHLRGIDLQVAAQLDDSDLSAGLLTREIRVLQSDSIDTGDAGFLDV